MDIRVPSAIAVGAWGAFALYTLSYTVEAYQHSGGISKADAGPGLKIKLPGWLQTVIDFGKGTEQLVTHPGRSIAPIQHADGTPVSPSEGRPSPLNQLLPDFVNNLFGIK
jgi:hypothetical protein